MRGALIILGAAALLAGCADDGRGAELVGEPCRTLTAQEAAGLGYTTNTTSSIGGVTFRRQYGTATCNEAQGGARCDFSTPGLVHVTAGGTESYFQVTPGQPATVVANGTSARCVVGRQPT